MGAGAKINSENIVGGNIAKVSNANCYDDITFQSMDSMAAVVNAVKNQDFSRPRPQGVVRNIVNCWELDWTGSRPWINHDDKVGGSAAKVSNVKLSKDITFQSMDSMASVDNAVQNQVCSKNRVILLN